MRNAALRQADARQMHLALFAPHELRAWEQEQRRRTLLRQQRPRHAPSRFQPRDDGATRALFDHDQHTPAECCEGWSDRAVEQLHEGVLRHSLRALQVGGGAARRELLRWIFAPQPMVAVLRDARGHPFEAVLPPSLIPFSFERCCRICGYSAERLRDGLVPLLRERGLGNVINEIAHGSKQHATGGDPAALQDTGDLQHAAGLRGG